MQSYSLQNLWLCCTESLALSPRLPLGFPTITGENTGEHVCLPNVESNTQPLLWEALLAVTGGCAPGLADFRSLERCENAKGREDWQNYWLWYFIISHFSRGEMHWQLHLSNQMLPEVPRTVHIPEMAIPTKPPTEGFIFEQSNQQHCCFSLCLISLFLYVGSALPFPITKLLNF